MKRIFLILLILIILINFVSAGSVCVVVDYGDQIKTQCLNAKEGIDGTKLLDSTIFDLSWSEAGIYGKALCKIDGVGDDVLGTGCEWGTKYWGFYILKNQVWSYMPVGFSGSGDCWNRDLFSYNGHYCVNGGDILGFKYGGYGIFPNLSNIMFKLEDITISVNGKDQEIEEEETIENIKPESEIEISMELKNIYQSNTNVQIEVKIENINDGKNLEKKSKKTNINAGSSQKIDLDFKLPLEVDEGEYDMLIIIEGEDEMGVFYTREIGYEIEIEKENNQLKIDSLELFPEEVNCGDNATLTASLINIGANKEDVQLKILNSDLEINLQDNFLLSNNPFKNNSGIMKEYNLAVKNVKGGIYPLQIIISYNGKEKKEVIDLSVECKEYLENSDSGIIRLNSAEGKLEESFIEGPRNLFFIFGIVGVIVIFAFIFFIKK